jgi:hypothetical protein
MYGVGPGPDGIELMTIDLATGLAKTVGYTGLKITILALEFAPDGKLLYGVTAPFKSDEDDTFVTALVTIDTTDGTATEFVRVGGTTAATGALAVASPTSIVSGLAFVPGWEPPDVDPVETTCSSTLTSPMTAGSEIAERKLFGFRLKRHHKHRAVGFFKFKATAGESVTIRLAADEEIFAEAEKKSIVYKLWKHWSKSRHKGRAFLGLRDAIPGVKVKKKTKGRLPLELTVEDLPAGWYYIMVVQPLFRFDKVDYWVDYHLTLDTGDPAGQTCQTLRVAWPSADSEEDSASIDESGGD